MGQTHFDLEITPEICDILDFEIEDEHRRKGYGKKLYLIIEELARTYKCKRIQTSPSGDGVVFWPHIGLTQSCKIGIEKILL